MIGNLPTLLQAQMSYRSNANSKMDNSSYEKRIIKETQTSGQPDYGKWESLDKDFNWELINIYYILKEKERNVKGNSIMEVSLAWISEFLKDQAKEEQI